MDELVNNIVNPSNDFLQKKIQEKLDNLTKPKGSLGYLETLVLKYCLCRGSENAFVNNKKLYVFSGDHGVTEEGVAPYPKEVTVQMVHNILDGGAAVSVMCKMSNVDCNVVNMGIDGVVGKNPQFLSHPVASCTKNFSRGAAMTKKQCLQAIRTGFSIAYSTQSDLFAIGEMGIGNTTSASALSALLLNENPVETVGMGTGATDSILYRKREIVKKSVLFHRTEWDGSAFDALRRLGGFEVAGMTGFIIGCAKKRIPVVIDGFITSVSALCAVIMNPLVKEYLIFSHVSDEQYHRKLLKKLEVRPLLSLNMRLGEGTGAVLGIHIIEQALACYHDMATFSNAGISNRDF